MSTIQPINTSSSLYQSVTTSTNGVIKAPITYGISNMDIPVGAFSLNLSQYFDSFKPGSTDKPPPPFVITYSGEDVPAAFNLDPVTGLLTGSIVDQKKPIVITITGTNNFGEVTESFVINPPAGVPALATGVTVDDIATFLDRAFTTGPNFDDSIDLFTPDALDFYDYGISWIDHASLPTGWTAYVDTETGKLHLTSDATATPRGTTEAPLPNLMISYLNSLDGSNGFLQFVNSDPLTGQIIPGTYQMADKVDYIYSPTTGGYVNQSTTSPLYEEGGGGYDP